MGRIETDREQSHAPGEPACLNLLLELLENCAKRQAHRLAAGVNKVHDPYPFVLATFS